MSARNFLNVYGISFAKEVEDIMQATIKFCNYKKYRDIFIYDFLFGMLECGNNTRKVLLKFNLKTAVLNEIFKKNNLNRVLSQEIIKVEKGYVDVIRQASKDSKVYEIELLYTIISCEKIASAINSYYSYDVSKKILDYLDFNVFPDTLYEEKYEIYSINESIPYCEDMTYKAFQGKYNEIVGRKNEIKRIEEILLKQKKSNPILVGQPGVGKTCIVEQLCIDIVKNRIKTLQGKKVIHLDTTSMISGAKYRGDFEERIKKVVDKIKNKENIIIFIDEIHSLTKLGSSEGAMSASDMLKPYLSSGSIKLIGATTFEGYRKNIENDDAFERRFEKVIVKEPTLAEVQKILKSIKSIYEKLYSVIIPNHITEYITYLAERYITSRRFPDKAIDILEEACIKLYIRNVNNSKTNNTINKKIVEEVVSQMTNIPIENLNCSEIKRILGLKTELSKKIIGQDFALEKVSQIIKVAKSGIADPNKPISFIFYGPTGVGKTELAKTLAEILFGSKNSMIRIDMSEYSEASSVNKLIGSAPGFVGFNESGYLIKEVKNKPYSILLFDEIEKAHFSIFNVFLQILDDGRLSNAKGETVNFKNTIIIMTSNIGFSFENLTKVGFNKTKENKYDAASNEGMKALEKNFRPEFLNRIDSIILFNKLTFENKVDIVKKLLKEIKEQLHNLNYTLDYDEEIVNYIAKEVCDDKYGARPLKRYIEQIIKPKIADIIFESKNSIISLEVVDDKLKIKERVEALI